MRSKVFQMVQWTIKQLRIARERPLENLKEIDLLESGIEDLYRDRKDLRNETHC